MESPWPGRSGRSRPALRSRWSSSPRWGAARRVPRARASPPTSTSPSSRRSCSTRWPPSWPTSRFTFRSAACARSELDPDMASRHPLRILLAEDNVVNQKVALQTPGPARLPGGSRRQRARGHRRRGPSGLRCRPHGRADAGARRFRGLPRDQPPLVEGPAPADRRDDGQRDAGGPRAVRRRRHGRLRREADPGGGAGGRARAITAALGCSRARRARSLPGRGWHARGVEAPRVPRRTEAPRERLAAADAIDRSAFDRLAASMGGAFVAELRRHVRRGRSGPDHHAAAGPGRGGRRHLPAGGPFTQVHRRDSRRHDGWRRSPASSKPRPAAEASTRWATGSTSWSANTSAQHARWESYDVTSPGNAQTGTLLVVDDNRVNRLLLGRALEQLGHTVTFAENGREGLEALRRTARRPRPAGHRDARDGRLPGAGGPGRRPASPGHSRRDDVLRRGGGQRRPLHRDGRRGLPLQAGEPGAAPGTGRRQPGEEAPPRPSARAVPEVRHGRGGGGAPDVRPGAGRQARRGERDVLRHPQVHEPHGDAVARRHHRAA